MKIAGNYGILSVGSLELRNFSTLTDTLISPNVYRGYNDVTANGNITFAQDNQVQGKYDIVQYQNGTSNIISTDSGGTKTNLLPATDGRLVVYDKTDYPFNIFGSHAIYLYNGNREVKLGDMGNTFPGIPPYFFQVNNGYLVYTSLDSSNQMELWRSDSTGVGKLVTPYPVESQLELLDSRGDFTFLRHSTPTNMRRYYATRNDSIMDIASYMGQAYFRDTSWYLVLGRTLYRVNIHISPDRIQNSSIPIAGDSVYTFSTTDFTNNFIGPGQLIKVRIIRLPKYGSLTLNGVQVQVNDEMPRSSLPNLSYSPGINFRSDSVFWEGSNGIQYAADSGIINIFSGRLPVKPILSAIPDHLCKTAAIQKIRILNLPDSTQGTYAVVKLDNILQTIGKDSSISIDPENLSTGSHLIQAIYYNTVGSDTSDVGLSIDSTVIPRVAMSSNQTVITGAATQITITADNVTGGGSSPTYTFGNNSSFSQVLQSESLSNVYTFSSLILQPGHNRIYVKMNTSDSCYSVQYATDSLDIIKWPRDGIIDPDFPDFPISINPNPFTSQLRISGLQASKSYLITLYDEAGRQMVSITAAMQDEAVINIFLPQGVYLIKVFDKQKNRTIGSRAIIAQ